MSTPSDRTGFSPVPAGRWWTDWPIQVRVAVVGTCSVMVACWAVSYDAIVVGAQAASIPFGLALLAPVIVDGEMAIGTVVLVSLARHVGIQTRLYLGALILLSVTVSMAANMSGPYTRTHLLPEPWSWLAAGVPSLWIALVVHQLVILWRHLSPPEPRLVDTVQAIRPAPVQAVATNGRTPSRRRTPGVRADAIAAYLEEQVGQGREASSIGVSEIARATGIPRATVYRLRPGAEG